MHGVSHITLQVQTWSLLPPSSQFSVLPLTLSNLSLFTLFSICSVLYFAVQPSSTSAINLIGVLSSYQFDRNSLVNYAYRGRPDQEAAQFKLWDGQRNCHNFPLGDDAAPPSSQVYHSRIDTNASDSLLSRCRGKGKSSVCELFSSASTGPLRSRTPEAGITSQWLC